MKKETLHITADLVTFAEEILNGKLHFLCSETEICVKMNFTYYVLFLIRIVKFLAKFFIVKKFHLLSEQSSEDVLKKSYSENLQQIFRIPPMPKCDFKEVAKQLYWNHSLVWVFFVNVLHIFRTPFPKNTFGGLLLCCKIYAFYHETSSGAILIQTIIGKKNKSKTVINNQKKWQKLKDQTNPPDMFLGKGVLKICSKFIAEHTCLSV